MPSWNIHLEVGERVAKKLKLTKRQKELFLLGNLLPDINNGYVNKKVKIVKEHHDTHWAFDEKSSLNFYAKYRKEIEAGDPIFLGYLLHLYTDGFFNYIYYLEMEKSGQYQGWERVEQRKIKHNDFWIFNTKFKARQLVLSDLDAAAREANRIQGVKVDAEDLAEIKAIIASDEFEKMIAGKTYIFFSEVKLDELLARAVENFTKDYLKNF